MRGNITKRGDHSWRLKFDLDRVDGKRRVRTITINGTRKDAEAKLAELLNDQAKGRLIDPSTITVGERVRAWLAGKSELTAGTVEGYLRIIEKRIEPGLGAVELQRLRPADVKGWLDGLRSRKGQKLKGQTLKHAFNILNAALDEAVRLDLVSRNVAGSVTPPRRNHEEVEILTADPVNAALASLDGSRLHTLARLAFATGARRSELLALRWSDLNSKRGVVKIERSLEQTKGKLAFKSTKTKHGRRSITLPASAVAMLGGHRREQLELRMKIGLGKPDADALIFCNHDGEPISPNYVSTEWRRLIRKIGLKVTFHSLRHSHASALIAAGLDVLSISRRLGHSRASITLDVYSHLFKNDDGGAAEAIEKAMR